MAVTEPAGVPKDITTESKAPGAWARYYKNAEPHMERQWARLIWPVISNEDFTVTLDFACGTGRNTQKLLGLARKIYTVDVNRDAINECVARFADHPEVTCLIGDGHTLSPIPDATFTFVYSFDAVVHFNIDLISEYLVEFKRVMKPGATAFIHHSNVGSGGYGINKGGRGNASAVSFKQACESAGLDCYFQKVIDWAGESNSDCLSMFRK
jgi:ubiquinone/menaquinone biosynthesis C-methylase UbiE